MADMDCLGKPVLCEIECKIKQTSFREGDNDGQIVYPLTSVPHGSAISERISAICRLTTARRYMIDNLADRVNAARSRARVLTLVSYAGAIGRAVRADHALWSATFVRVSVEIGQASAGGRAGDLAAHGIRPARRRLARI